MVVATGTAAFGLMAITLRGLVDQLEPTEQLFRATLVEVIGTLAGGGMSRDDRLRATRDAVEKWSGEEDGKQGR